MKHILTIILLSLYLIISLDVNAQDIEFRHLSTADGLTHFSVISLYQDERDFIWCGTRNGVSLYNGREFKEYRYHKGDTTSLFCNTITAITGDRAGHVFLHTVLGMALFDMTSEKFSVLFKGDVSAMLYDDRLYFACNNVIYTYDGGKVNQYYELPDRTNQIVSLNRNDGRLYIGTERNGLYLLSADNKLQHPIQRGKIGSIFKDSRKRLWVGSWDSGLYLFSNDSIMHYRHQANETGSISSDFIRVCCEDSQGHIWIGTFNGLNRFDEKSQTFVSYLRREEKSGNLYYSVWSLLCDHQGTLWIGTYHGGLCCINPQKEIFYHFHASQQEQKGLSYSTVGKMTEDNRNNIWICTDGGGLNMYNPQSGSFKWYFHNDSRNSISHDNTRAFWYDSDKDVLWIGTHLGGLSRLDLKTDVFTNYYAKKSRKGDLRTNIISTIIPYKGKLILATQGGVMLFDPATGNYEQLFSGPDGISTIQRVNDLLIDHRGILWIVGSDGIYSYRFEDGKMTYYQSDPSKPGTLCSPHIHTLYLDSRHNLWICSADSGIDLYNYETDSFENFSGLSGDCVYGVCELLSGNLLALTNRGISLLGMRDKEGTGLIVLSEWPMKTINENSVFQSKDSTIYVGRVDGMISFKESDLLHPSVFFHIFPYRLLVNGHEIEVGDDTGILKESITIAKKIVLKSSQSVFTIGYAASNYLPGEPEHLVYQLKGFSDIWTPLRDSREITYTNLKPGSYTLIVKSIALTGDAIPESSLEIEILPPWYLTIWAYLFYVIFAVLTVYYLIRVYHNRIKLQESLKYERQHTHDVEELNQSKLRFFTNVSHEFRTPLTLIIGQMETLLQGKLLSPPVYQKFFSVYKNSIQLKELISELLDFRKQEQGYMKMKVCENDIASFLFENYLLFKEYADTKGIQMIFEKPDQPVSLWYNAKQMQKVINNILSNALKYTSCGGVVTLSVCEDGDDVLMEIADNGCGIDAQEIDKIFDRFYQSNPSDSSTGTGVGLALTKSIVELHGGTIKASGAKGEGMTFTIRLKRGKEHFLPEQLEEETSDVTNGYLQDYNTEEMPLPLLLDDDMAVEGEIIQEKENDLRMLVVEDNKQLRELLVQIFAPFYSVVSAEDGEEGLEKVKAETFNIIISDIVMPKLSGIDLCKEIKNNMETCHIPVILLTARMGVEHNLEGLRIGADDYITKPFNVPILISRCNNIVKNRLMLQEKFSKQPFVGPQVLSSNPLDKEFLDEVIEIIEKHLSDSKFNVDVLVSEMLIGRTRLFHKLKAITGQTPSDFISNIRLKKAAFWLKNNPEFNISEIAYRTGYTSARYFSKSFKEKYGLIPSEYRKEPFEPNQETDVSVFE